MVITRADFLMSLGKLSGADVSVYAKSSFNDVANDSVALPYIEWAYKNKITDGVGGGKFTSHQIVTREQMAVMLAHYSKVCNLTLPELRSATAFDDAPKISSWAQGAVTTLQRANIIVGKTGNRSDPRGSMTRAEASSVLRRFAESVVRGKIGWVQTEKGQWQYIQSDYTPQIGWLITAEGDNYYFGKDGFRVSGQWLQIDGEWYYFFSDGKMAVNTQVDEYIIGEDGVRK